MTSGVGFGGVPNPEGYGKGSRLYWGTSKSGFEFIFGMLHFRYLDIETMPAFEDIARGTLGGFYQGLEDGAIPEGFHSGYLDMGFSFSDLPLSEQFQFPAALARFAFDLDADRMPSTWYRWQWLKPATTRSIADLRDAIRVYFRHYGKENIWRQFNDRGGDIGAEHFRKTSLAAGIGLPAVYLRDENGAIRKDATGYIELFADRSWLTEWPTFLLLVGALRSRYRYIGTLKRFKWMCDAAWGFADPADLPHRLPSPRAMGTFLCLSRLPGEELEQFQRGLDELIDDLRSGRFDVAVFEWCPPAQILIHQFTPLQGLVKAYWDATNVLDR